MKPSAIAQLMLLPVQQSRCAGVVAVDTATSSLSQQQPLAYLLVFHQHLDLLGHGTVQLICAMLLAVQHTHAMLLAVQYTHAIWWTVQHTHVM